MKKLTVFMVLLLVCCVSAMAAEPCWSFDAGPRGPLASPKVLDAGESCVADTAEYKYLTVQTIPDFASGVLTAPSNFVDGATITVDDRIFTFESAALDVADEVDLKSSRGESLQALAHAINGTGTPGTDYATGTEPHATVTAASTDNLLRVTARLSGSASNEIATTESSTAAWADASLTDVEDPTITVSGADGPAASVHSGVTELVTDDRPIQSVILVSWRYYLVSVDVGAAMVGVGPVIAK